MFNSEDVESKIAKIKSDFILLRQSSDPMSPYCD